MRFARMALGWAQVAHEHGRLSKEGQAFLKQMGR